jgi:hypothetical protein
MQIKTTSSLSRWLNGFETLQPFVDGTRFRIDETFPFWVSLMQEYPAHMCSSLEAQDLKSSWEETRKYIIEASKIIHTCMDEEPMDVLLDSEDRAWIVVKLGYPPKPCYPIYIFSVSDGNTERPVYVGITSSRSGRFIGGHNVITKLLDPIYEGCTKKLYLCQVTTLAEDGGYLPLEWINPYTESRKLLEDIESYLIYHLQAEFNAKKKNRNCSRRALGIHIVNYCGEEVFLHDEYF